MCTVKEETCCCDCEVCGLLGFNYRVWRSGHSLINKPASMPPHRYSLFSCAQLPRDVITEVPHIYDIRQQLTDQLKCLDVKLETEVSIVGELQEFFRRRAEVELDYARNLDKLVKQMITRHRAEKQSRQEQWATMSTYTCWKHLLGITRKESQNHTIISEIYSNQMVSRLQEVCDNSQRIFRKCREIGAESHEDILKVLNELQSAMKTYHMYQAEAKQAEVKLRGVESQKTKVEQQLSGKTSTSRKLKGLHRQVEKKDQKYRENKLKALKARNDYLLCIEAANSAINKYFSDDISDLMDCMDFGYHNSVGRAMMMYLSIHEHLRTEHTNYMESLNKCISDLDSRADKHKFMELNNQVFMLPKKFDFQPFKGDDVSHITVQKEVMEDLLQRYTSINDRLNNLKVQNDEIWKSLETTEKSLVEVIQVKDYDISRYFLDEAVPQRSPHEAARYRTDHMETETYYLEKFREYMLSCNRLARLQTKYNSIQKAIGDRRLSSAGPEAPPPKPRKRRIGCTPPIGHTKLFGGSLEEYIEGTGEEIPIIIRSCIRVINLYGMHHQGLFRVSGAQVEINNFKTVFESGEDALVDVVDASDMNSVAGVLKLYFRELREPLFPLHLFDALVECTQEIGVQRRLDRIKDLLATLPRSIFVVMRYLFAFLNHLSEYSDENMMDPYNLAICFGPTLLPIPPDRDQVSYQASVNEIIKTIIIHQEELFPNDGGPIYEKCILENSRNILSTADDDDEDETCSIPSDDEESVREAVALHDYEGRSTRELSFRKGETIMLYTQASGDWWEGCCHGQEGLIPDKYISLRHSLRDEGRSASQAMEDRSSSSTPSMSHTPPRALMARQGSADSTGDPPHPDPRPEPRPPLPQTQVIVREADALRDTEYLQHHRGELFREAMDIYGGSLERDAYRGGSESSGRDVHRGSLERDSYRAGSESSGRDVYRGRLGSSESHGRDVFNRGGGGPVEDSGVGGREAYRRSESPRSPRRDIYRETEVHSSREFPFRDSHSPKRDVFRGQTESQSREGYKESGSRHQSMDISRDVGGRDIYRETDIHRGDFFRDTAEVKGRAGMSIGGIESLRETDRGTDAIRETDILTVDSPDKPQAFPAASASSGVTGSDGGGAGGMGSQEMSSSASTGSDLSPIQEDRELTPPTIRTSAPSSSSAMTSSYTPQSTMDSSFSRQTAMDSSYTRAMESSYTPQFAMDSSSYTRQTAMDSSYTRAMDSSYTTHQSGMDSSSYKRQSSGTDSSSYTRQSSGMDTSSYMRQSSGMDTSYTTTTTTTPHQTVIMDTSYPPHQTKTDSSFTPSQTRMESSYPPTSHQAKLETTFPASQPRMDTSFPPPSSLSKPVTMDSSYMSSSVGMESSHMSMTSTDSSFTLPSSLEGSHSSSTSTTATTESTSSPSLTDSATDELSLDIDHALEEVMLGLKSLEMQQREDKRKSSSSSTSGVGGGVSCLPLVKLKQTPKHTPDLVLDLPERSHPSPTSSQESSDQESPTTAAETFAQSNQGTLKKADAVVVGPITTGGAVTSPAPPSVPARTSSLGSGSGSPFHQPRDLSKGRGSISSEPGDVGRGEKSNNAVKVQSLISSFDTSLYGRGGYQQSMPSMYQSTPPQSHSSPHHHQPHHHKPSVQQSAGSRGSSPQRQLGVLHHHAGKAGTLPPSMHSLSGGSSSSSCSSSSSTHAPGTHQPSTHQPGSVSHQPPSKQPVSSQQSSNLGQQSSSLSISQQTAIHQALTRQLSSGLQQQQQQQQQQHQSSSSTSSSSSSVYQPIVQTQPVVPHPLSELSRRVPGRASFGGTSSTSRPSLLGRGGGSGGGSGDGSGGGGVVARSNSVVVPGTGSRGGAPPTYPVTQTDLVRRSSTPPPVAQKPKPPVKVKPPVMKKPNRPEFSSPIHEPTLSSSPPRTTSPFPTTHQK